MICVTEWSEMIITVDEKLSITILKRYWEEKKSFISNKQLFEEMPFLGNFNIFYFDMTCLLIGLESVH